MKLNDEIFSDVFAVFNHLMKQECLESHFILHRTLKP